MMDTGTEDSFTIAYRHPAEPEGAEPVVAAVISLGGEDYPLTVRAVDGGEGRVWAVEFGDLADEGDHPHYAEALKVAHRRALDDAEGLKLATQDGSY